ncbi:hypothetical protein HN709_04640 [Candidatus Peregrinibacteria bacterium]|jgi:3D (Asp-Asp-Asp) domain-containing protein|nr:hypothetical protein [Candidatus Peregrinibacteria bacterium]MBT7736951.1 hypothetical protein [Candidatus Peregrinibacteria bacterium]
MDIKKIIKRLVCDAAAVLIVAMLITPFSSPTGVLAESEGFESQDGSYPYSKTFTISAYYSPLACQQTYVTGSYRGDIRLNGNGTNGADGTEVYPGMIAAPKSYDFGTKMYIPGVGIVAVHDRGGAIVEHDGSSGVYDRLDIWMGYGDIGLRRALNWGKRNVDVTVYGINPGIAEELELSGYSPSEAIPQECDWNEESSSYEAVGGPVDSPVLDEEIDEADLEDFEEILRGFNEDIVAKVLKSVEISKPVKSYLAYGDSGSGVKALQEELKNINFYMAEATGVYDDVTEHAVFKFQQSQGIISSTSDHGAGVFGPKTSSRLNSIVGSRNYTNVLVAATTQGHIQTNNGNYIAVKPEDGNVVVAAN